MRRFSGEVTNGLKHYQPEIQQKKQGRFLWRRVSTSESQNDCQFDELNGEEAMHKWKVKLSEQLFRHFEQQLQGMFNLNGKFWRCFYYLRGNKLFLWLFDWYLPKKQLKFEADWQTFRTKIMQFCAIDELRCSLHIAVGVVPHLYIVHLFTYILNEIKLSFYTQLFFMKFTSSVFWQRLVVCHLC